MIMSILIKHEVIRIRNEEPEYSLKGRLVKSGKAVLI